MRRGAALVAFALLAAASVAQPAEAQSAWERPREGALAWLGSEDPAAALARLGGSRELLVADPDDLRATMLGELRDNVRHVLLDEARIPYASLDVRGGNAELRLRDPSFLPSALSALDATTGPAHDAIDIRDAGDGLVKLAPTERTVASRLNGSLDQAVDIIRRRLAGLGIARVSVQRDDVDRILVQEPGVYDTVPLMDVIAATARLEFRLVDISMSASDAARMGAPADSEVLYEARTHAPFLVRKAAALGGQDIEDARPSFSQNDAPAVDFRFTTRGAGLFGQFTQENVGRPFAIVLDGKVLTAPVIQTPILGGRGQITGNFTVEQANDLAVLLRAGMLPVRLVWIEHRTIAPAKK